jgi:hypothetical protein
MRWVSLICDDITNLPDLALSRHIWWVHAYRLCNIVPRPQRPCVQQPARETASLSRIWIRLCHVERSLRAMTEGLHFLRASPRRSYKAISGYGGAGSDVSEKRSDLQRAPDFCASDIDKLHTHLRRMLDDSEVV